MGGLNELKWMVGVSTDLRGTLSSLLLPPDEGEPASGHRVIAKSITLRTKNYIERVSEQVNETYERGCYDACLVMSRRLIETLNIECFEKHAIANRAKVNGNFMMFQDLIDVI